MQIRSVVRASSSAVTVSALVWLGALGAGCRVDAKVNAAANANEPVDRSESETSAAPSPSPSAAPVAAPPPAPAAPPADACPLFCYEALGAVKANLTAEETAQLRTSLEPVLGRMRTCTSPEDWRRHGSPFVNLRIGPDGSLSELGVDPHHGRESGCFEDAGRGAGNVSASLPGRKVVRCAERCVTQPSAPGLSGAARTRRRTR